MGEWNNPFFTMYYAHMFPKKQVGDKPLDADIVMELKTIVEFTQQWERLYWDNT